MLHAGECAQRLAHRVGRDAHPEREKRTEHRVFEIVPAGNLDLVRADEVEFAVFVAIDNRVSAQKQPARHLALARKIVYARRRQPRHIAHHRVVIVQHRDVVFRLVVENLALGSDIVLHRAKVVKMVFRNVANARSARMEMHIALELQPRRLRDDDVANTRFQRVFGDRHADVAKHKRVSSAVFEDFARQRGAGRLAVGSGDADKLRVAKPIAEFDLADDLDSPLFGGAHKRYRHRNNRADDDERNAVEKCLWFFAQPPLDRNAIQRLA